MLAKTRTVQFGSTTFQRDSVTSVLNGWSREHLHAELRRLADVNIQRQLDMGYTPTQITVDNSSYKSVLAAEKRIVILYGVQAAKAVMLAVEEALMTAIGLSTDKKTGKLGDINNWQWTYVPGSATGDVLFLRPKENIFYATAANQNVAGGRRSFVFKKTEKRGRKRVATNRYGFFGAAARLLRSNPTVKSSFHVRAELTTYTLDNEVATRGPGRGGPLITGQIMIRPKKYGYAVARGRR
jgi:hypothetical protein